ncbi:MAG TPA: alkaline phosphatase D family protein [Thermoanaerobaculia bacterium]
MPKLTRRLALLLLALAPLAVHSQQTASQQTQQNAPEDLSGCLSSGPMLGPAELTGTTVWLQTRRPCRVQVRYWQQGKPETARLSDEVRTDAAGDHIARFRLSGLDFGARYDYEIYLEGLRVARSYPLTFQAQPMWRYRTDPPTFRAAIGSCAYINDPAFDRPGEPYGGNYEIFQSIAAARPDFMVWLGDNIYYREGDWSDEASMRRRWTHDRALPEMQPLLGAVHHYAIWDDHDYGSNDADRSFRLRETSLRVFQDYWANPSYGEAETPGVFTRFDWSDVEFFLLDDRYHRSANELPIGPDKRMYGEAQIQWLKNALTGSRATFKIVAGGSQFWNPLTFYEAFGKFPTEQQELLDFLRQTRIEGVVFLSGDRHHTELLKRQEPGIYPLYEFTSSPLTSGGSRLEKEAENPARVPGTWVTGIRNFGLIEVSGKPDDRVLTLRTLDFNGKELWKREIRAAELRFPK